MGFPQKHPPVSYTTFRTVPLRMFAFATFMFGPFWWFVYLTGNSQFIYITSQTFIAFMFGPFWWFVYLTVNLFFITTTGSGWLPDLSNINSITRASFTQHSVPFRLSLLLFLISSFLYLFNSSIHQSLISTIIFLLWYPVNPKCDSQHSLVSDPKDLSTFIDISFHRFLVAPSWSLFKLHSILFTFYLSISEPQDRPWPLFHRS